MTSRAKGDVVLEARGLSRAFNARSNGGLFAKKTTTVAVDGVSLTLRAGEVVAVVGESGSGKSVLARMLARIVTPTEGELVLNGTAVDLSARRDLAYAAAVQLVLQDPFASINPVRTVNYPLERALTIHGTANADLERRTHELLESVALTPPGEYLSRYPHELSGGQLQRINIARGLAVGPEVLLADEPISMLDVSVRLGILNLLRALGDERQLAMLYITHDIASARYIADETAVMYAGQVVERARGTTVIDAPTHPYTQLLVASVPNPEHLHHQSSTADRATAAAGFNRDGCRFSPRCPSAMSICHGAVPPEVMVDDDHMVRCWLVAPEGDRQAVELRRSSPANA